MAYRQIRVCNLYPTQEGSFLLVIEEIKSHQKFGIFTLKNEAMHILSFMYEKYPPRPSLYEVFSKYLSETNVQIAEIRITQYKQSVYHAELVCKDSSNTEKTFDIKATDAIAIAYLNKKPLYADEQVIQNCSIIYTPIIEKMEKRLTNDKSSGKGTFSISKEDLYEEQLKHAIESENYELAAELKKKLEAIRKNKA
ncbi:MAG: bifunctional nuclease family protein [Paludibacteraceae bacterium]|nr:bifunctional nuclease family protein [Paludibacteraceae bacterium]